MAAPKKELSDLLSWLGAEWHEDCLRFYERDNAVRTASVWAGAGAPSREKNGSLEALRGTS